MRGRLIVVFLGCSTSFCYWAHEIAWSNQNSECFKSASQLCMLDLVYDNDDYGTRTKLFWLVWVHQRLTWRHAKHIVKALSLTRYETLLSLIGYFIIANQLWCKRIVPKNALLDITLNESQKGSAPGRSSIYFTSVYKAIQLKHNICKDWSCLVSSKVKITPFRFLC